MDFLKVLLQMAKLLEGFLALLTLGLPVLGVWPAERTFSSMLCNPPKPAALAIMVGVHSLLVNHAVWDGIDPNALCMNMNIGIYS